MYHWPERAGKAMQTNKEIQLHQEDVRRIVSSIFHAHWSSSLWHTNDSSRIDEAVAALDGANYRKFVAQCLFFFNLGSNAVDVTKGPLSMGELVESICRHPLDSFNFQTSGTTGRKKTIPYRLHVLAGECMALAPLLGSRRRLVSVVPEHHIFGFAFSVILPKFLGIPVVRMAPLPTGSFLDCLCDGDLVLAFPRFWQALLSILEHHQEPLPKYLDLKGISSTAPCPPEVLDGLLDHLLCEVTEIYGSTETSAVGYRMSPRRPYTLLANWERTGEGAEVRIVRRHVDGTKGEPQPLLDRVEWVSGRQFFPQGRYDHAVQVGGVNVYPQKIAKMIETHPDVSECAVRLMRPEEGVRLKAFIVPAPAVHLDECSERFGNRFRRWLQQRLPAPACPKMFAFGVKLPRNPLGKLSDW